jgi:hypothetical protein
MKTPLYSMLALTLAATLAACGNTTTPEASATQAPVATLNGPGAVTVQAGQLSAQGVAPGGCALVPGPWRCQRIVYVTRVDNPCAYSGTNARCKVDRAYAEILARPAEPAGFNAWVGSGIRGQALRNYFATSPEAATNIRTIAQACLLRDADPASLAIWQGSLASVGIESLANIFSTSAEAQAKGSPCQIVVQHVGPRTVPVYVDPNPCNNFNGINVLAVKPSESALAVARLQALPPCP